MSETPRTDEHLRMKAENGHVAIVGREFARQLERELADAIAKLRKLEEKMRKKRKKRKKIVTK
jgi:hypothetical protein